MSEEAAERQNPDKAKEDLSKDMSIDSRNDMYWALLGLYMHSDVQKMFCDEGEAHFLSIALLARIHFGKIPSSAFQERVFSTEGIGVGPLHTRTDSGRAE
ncbi:hypothetical protein JG688_00014284 [Phytophthora aleatoria]|uniref:Uncharacterized protein n=1 Tax=Phytophthora aleatoria TaxID=2496075 RepID=A0A8J5IKA8_9STRA|nr:hypothetical protein JG688_00014284 [Phytophthora aleatoria]